MKCTSLKRKCAKCGWKAQGKHEAVCPECGADMHCTASAVPGYSVCRYHGGPVPSRNFYGRGPMKDGSNSSFQLSRLAASYNRMVTDGKVLSNRAAVDLIDQRIQQLLERVDLDEAPDRIKALYEKWEELNSYTIPSPEFYQAREELNAIFERIYHDYAAWNQIFLALDLRGKTTEREIKALKEIHAILTAEDAYELAAKLMAAVMRVIGDEPKKIKQVQYEFARIIGESSDRVTAQDADDDGGGVEEAGGET